MATIVNKIFKPRRGTKSAMASSFRDTILQDGEMFVELPDAQQGVTGYPECKIKIGNGVTPYSNLPYSVGDIANDTVQFTDLSGDWEAINSILDSNNSKLSLLIAAFKKAINLLKDSFETTEFVLAGTTTLDSDNKAVVVFEDSSITEDSLIDIYTQEDAIPESIEQSEDQKTITIKFDSNFVGKEVRLKILNKAPKNEMI